MMAPSEREFLDADIQDVLLKLTVEEKTKLLSAPDWWNTHKIPRLGIPAVRMSDGPNVCSYVLFAAHEFLLTNAVNRG